MKQVLAIIAGWITRIETKQWALRHGIGQWFAELLSAAAGSAVSAALMRA